ncbi:hypothetical protein [Ralstonia pseudosolanacearum]|uniref:hypothetical protein n=1 Tax=Ralstonia pseudosolanacearum TaxID=1310165 RepID=UPI003CF5D059
MQQITLDALRLIRFAGPVKKPFVIEDLGQLHTFSLIERDFPKGGIWHSMPRLTIAGVLVADAVATLESAPDGAVVSIPPVSSFDLALLARVALARFRVLGFPSEELLALGLAREAGYKAHPCADISQFVEGEAELLSAWNEGWSKRAYETRPLTEEDLKAKIAVLSKEANHGCGQFYELYQQKFTAMVKGWLPTLRENEREMALKLLGDDYNPDEQGTWVYDQEENDIHLI